ncbi:CRYD-like protein [Mya arenaria]|uniref:Cryptochrome DASH n=1 Tax=Mya arenaria TaxID=6604 RepID=A0ABY7FAV9_MYAAR|nr:CRYD-like protein [Mya arenaria]
MVSNGLIIRRGKPEVVIPEIIQQLGPGTVQAVTFQEEATSEELDVEAGVRKACGQCGVKVQSLWGHTLFHRDDLPFSAKQLAIGCISPRQIYHEIKRYEKERTSNQSTYWVIFELLWRDYFRFVALKYGNRLFYLSGIQGKHIQWKQDKKLFEAWKDGRTGVPFVDANMREMAATGFMSNRGRQNVASFLTKDLKLDWRLGAEWFESMLVDHDVCSNYGNWLYSAGLGNDPREDRKFNMVKQGLDYDPQGDYVRLWVPELKDVAGGSVHTVWTLSNSALSKADVSLGETYPNPVVIAPEWARHAGKTVHYAAITLSQSSGNPTQKASTTRFGNPAICK